jgi:hypothetical protein
MPISGTVASWAHGAGLSALCADVWKMDTHNDNENDWVDSESSVSSGRRDADEQDEVPC